MITPVTKLVLGIVGGVVAGIGLTKAAELGQAKLAERKQRAEETKAEAELRQQGREEAMRQQQMA